MPSHHGKLGYETRSWAGALLMFAGDHARFWHWSRPFAWADDVVISSLGGLGDVMIQLPLITALEQKVKSSGGRVRVALRPGNVEVGQRLGWEILPWENPLVTTLQRGFSLEVMARAAAQAKRLRREKIALWVDLTGHVLNAVQLKASGVRRLASRTSSGGKSFIDHPLPHVPYVNEYETPQILARFFDVEPERAIYGRLIASAVRGDEIILAVTSGRWKRWPLEFFAELVRARPNHRFVLAGMRRELAADEGSILDELEALPNVRSGVNRFSVLELIQEIAQARAIITPDSAAQHIATAYGTPGLVLFGPELDTVWTPRQGGLRVLHDTSCPLFPCHYQIGCRRPRDWCMRKIRPEQVLGELDQVLAAEIG